MRLSAYLKWTASHVCTWTTNELQNNSNSCAVTFLACWHQQLHSAHCFKIILIKYALQYELPPRF